MLVTSCGERVTRRGACERVFGGEGGRGGGGKAGREKDVLLDAELRFRGCLPLEIYCCNCCNCYNNC